MVCLGHQKAEKEMNSEEAFIVSLQKKGKEGRKGEEESKHTHTLSLQLIDWALFVCGHN